MFRCSCIFCTAIYYQLSCVPLGWSFIMMIQTCPPSTNIITLFYHNFYSFWEMVEVFSVRKRTSRPAHNRVFFIKNEGHNKRNTTEITRPAASCVKIFKCIFITDIVQSSKKTWGTTCHFSHLNTKEEATYSPTATIDLWSSFYRITPRADFVIPQVPQ